MAVGSQKTRVDLQVYGMGARAKALEIAVASLPRSTSFAVENMAIGRAEKFLAWIEGQDYEDPAASS